MKKFSIKVIVLGLIGLMTFGAFLNVNLERKYKLGQYIPDEDAYYSGEIISAAGHIKAHKFVTPSDNEYSTQKDYSHGTNMLGDLENTWGLYTGSGTTIAVIDDGFDYNHPEYVRANGTSAILNTSRYYYMSGNSVYNKKYSDDPSCIDEDWEYDDYEGTYVWATHGTATSTTAAAPMGNNGGVGIAPEANILALKIDMSFGAIEKAIRYAVDEGADVINMSLGAFADFNFKDGFGNTQNPAEYDGETYSAEDYADIATYLESACQYAYNHNVIVVAAAGNEATYHKSYPACNYKVVGVGALEKNDEATLARFTNYIQASQTGEVNVDILAPGFVYTAEKAGSQNSPTHTYNSTQGTSFSSPIVAGAACLWKQKNPSGTPDQFLSALQSTASDVGTYYNKYVPTNKYGYGHTKQGPSQISQGRLNVGNLLDINDPYVNLKQSSIDVVVGSTKQVQLDSYNGEISYSIQNTSIATVSNSGLVEGKAAGSTTLTVTASKNSTTASKTIPVNVGESIACQSLTISPTEVTIAAGETYEIEPTITTVPSNASRVFMFASNDETVATVDFEEGTVTGVAAGDTTIEIEALDGNGSAVLTVNVTAPATPTSWDKVTSDSDITSGADYLIVYEDGGYAFNGGLDSLDTESNRISVTISNNKITYDSTTAAAKFTIESMSGGYSIKSASGKYISGTSGKNELKSGTSASANTISISGGDADIISNTSHLRFNSDANQSRFRYFKSASYSNQKAIQLYKAAGGSTPTPTPTVSSVTVSPSSLSLDLNGTTSGNLIATVYGTNSPAQTVTWSSNNTSIATVSSSGVVTAKATGTATITATSTVDTTKSGTCEVTVVDTTATKTLLSISLSGSYPTSFEKGDTFSHAGMTVTANFSDSTSANVTSSATFTGYNMNSATTQTVTVSYTYDGVTKSTTYQITVTSSGGSGGGGTPFGEAQTVTYTIDSKTAASVSTGTAPSGSSIGFSNNGSNADDQMTSGTVETWTLSGYNGLTITSITARLHRNSSKGSGTVALTNNSVSVSLSKTTYSKADLTSSYDSYDIYTGELYVEGAVVLTLTSTENSFWCDSISVTYEEVDTSDKIVSSLSASYTGGNVFVGGTLDESTVTVTANYTDSSKYPSAVLNSKDYSITGFSSATAGQKTVTVTYTGSLEKLTNPMTTTFNVMVVEDTVTNVSVTNTRTYHPGETISKSDITVTLTYASGASTTTTDFTFANNGYQFTYADAPSGGSNGSKQFSITYAGSSYNFTVSVNRNAYQAPASESVSLTGTQGSFAGITGTSASGAANYNSLSINGITCSATNIYVYNGYFSFGKKTGELRNTVATSKPITSFSISGRASSARTDEKLYVSTNGSNWVLVGSANFTTTKYYFFKVTCESESTSYSNFNLSVGLQGQDNPTNVANYIMYEDTNNQCTTKLDLAIDKLNTMSSSDKSTFWTSSNYVIATARERLQAWARHEGKELDYSNGSFQISGARNIPSIIGFDGNDNGTTIFLIIISSISLVTVGGFIYIKKRKEH